MMDDLFSSPALASIDPGAATSIDILTHYQALLYDLSLLRHKIQQTESLIAAVVSAENCEQADAVVTGAGAVIHGMISTASSILFNLQHLSLCASDHTAVLNIGNCNNSAAEEQLMTDRSSSWQPPSLSVIELDAAALLARYTHYCHICSKGFRRDANLRMHMRAHGDEYKTRAALAKGGGGLSRDQKVEIIERKYSCPQEGCRWNWKHEKFQPLKSVTCAKNHYRRSHCPKLYLCSRCGHKEFSVLSDLHTHEKNCGNPRWRCSCGTTFSRKDKLMGHVALFVGHAPAPEGGGRFEGGAQASVEPSVACSW